MAVTQNTLIGRTRGRIGNVVFSQWKNLNIAKQKAESVANPRTGQQIANRLRFTALIALGKLLRPVLQFGFKEYAGTYTWMNKFMGVNAGTGCLVWDGIDTWELVPENLVISEGSLYPTPVSASSAAGIITVSWSPTAVNNQAGTDEVYIAVLAEEAHAFVIGDIGRSTGSAAINMSALPNSTPYTVIAFFMRYDTLIVSNSHNVSGILVNP